MKQLVLLTLTLALSVLCYGGDARGNGGGIVVCDDGSVDLLDLWEGEALKGMHYAHPQTNPLVQALTASAQLKLGHPAMRPEVETLIRTISAHAEGDGDWFLPSAVAIEPPRDAQNLFIKRGCHLEGVALYDDRSDRLDIDETLYRRLSAQQRAALFVHEAVYKFLRVHNGAQDSTLPRHYTACLFSGEECPELNPTAGIPEKGFFDCRASTNAERLAIFPVNPAEGLAAKQWRLQMLDPKPGEQGLVTRLFTDIALTNPHLDSTSQLLVDSAAGQTVGRNEWGYLLFHASTDRWRDLGQYQPPFSVDDNGLLHIEYNESLICKYK